MRNLWKLLAGFSALALIVMLVNAAGTTVHPVYAEDEPVEEEELIRLTTINVAYTASEWWLVHWSDNEIGCRFLVEHDGLPTGDEIKTWCGNSLYQTWSNSDPCEIAETGGDVSQCPGMYLSYFQSYDRTRDVEIELPLPSVWISLAGCDQQQPDNSCNSMPNLRLVAEEPLANESVIRINGFIGDEPFSCPGNECTVPLKATGTNGSPMEFWADSSFGDSSEHYTALIRVQPWGDFMSPDQASDTEQRWYVDVLSSQWRGAEPASASDVWQVFPEVGGPPPWLQTPDSSEELYSTYSLYYLAGMLIRNNEVDVSGCPDGGMETDEIANQCGVEAAYDRVVEWQNRFDEEIYQTALETGVPAQLLKNVFSRESQFWPGIYKTYQEAGLGQLTENGADTVLLWNPDFFGQFCPLVLDQSICDLGFGNLNEEEQAMMRGALVQKVNATCPDCTVGIDMTQANFSVKIFANTLLANCEQVGRLITNITRQSPGAVSNYEDLWRFTLANYNAGPGCLSSAIEDTYKSRKSLTWENVSANLEEGCQGAIDYVQDISVELSGVTPTPTSWVFQETVQATPSAGSVTPQPTTTPTPQSSPIGGATVTPNLGSYPLPGNTPTAGGGYPGAGNTPVPGGYP